MIEARGLTKRYGQKTAVDDLTFTVSPGVVTGFLGPNGAGKSTTMRLILGLDAPTGGTVRSTASSTASTAAPLHEVGALLEAQVDPYRAARAYNHLLALAQTSGIPRSRVDEVVDLVGLREVARKRAGGFSLGMGQRLGIASALLGDPHTLLLDEPVNGLDPDGIRWIRNLLKSLAAEGRTVFVSSHLMSEMAQTAEHLIVVGRGRLIADTSVDDFIARSSGNHVRVRTTDPSCLAAVLAGPDVSVEPLGGDALEVRGPDAPTRSGRRAAADGIVLLELIRPADHSRGCLHADLTRDCCRVPWPRPEPPRQTPEAIAVAR